MVVPSTGQPGWAPGAQVGDYRLEAPLGAGGMAQVYRATHLPTGAVRALKRLASGSSELEQERLLREGQAMARLEGHPNVLEVHAAGVHAGDPYLVLQLAAGGVNDAKVLLDKSIYEIKLIGLPPQKLRFLSNQITVSDENKPIVVPINMLDVKYPVELLAYYTEKGKKISGVITVKPGESRPVLPWKTSSLMPLPDKIVIAAPAGESTLIPYRGNTKAELVELSTKDMRGPAPVADFTCSSFSTSSGEPCAIRQPWLTI